MSQLPGWVAGSWSLGALVVLVPVLFLYFVGVTRLWGRAGRGKGVTILQVLAFTVGWSALAAALVSPLDTAATLLFSAHMLQHMLLAFIAAPLLAWSLAGLGILWALPGPQRKGIGRFWGHSPWFRTILAWLTAPLSVWLLFALSFWLWHIPVFYETAITNPLLHTFEHATMLGSAFLFWWLVLQPTGRRRLPHGAAILFVLATMLQGMVLATLISFARAPLYASYELSAAALGVSALSDQQLAGMIMRTPATMILVVTCVWLFLAWMSRLERLDQQAEPG